MAFATPPPPSPQSGKGLTGTNSALPAAPASVGARSSGSRQAHHQYQKAQVETASPTRLIVLLYDGAIRFCTLALDAMQARQLETQNINLIKAQRIVSELMSSLDRKVGGEVAENLFQLYTYMLEQLVHANLQDEQKPVETVIGMLRELRETWQEIDRITTQAQGPEAGATAPAAAGSSSQAPAFGGAEPGKAALPSNPAAILQTPAARSAQVRAARPAQMPSAPVTPSKSRLGDCDA